MPKSLGAATVFICPRCKFKYRRADMVRDPNTGLHVCNTGCADVFDPYRLPARRTEDISLTNVFPEEPLE